MSKLPGNIKAVMRTNSISWSIWHCEVNRKSTIYCIVKVVISAFRFLDQEITVLRSFLKLKFSVLSMPFYQLCSKTWKIHWRIIWKPAMGLRRKIRGKKQYSGVIAKWYMRRAYLPSIRKGFITLATHFPTAFGASQQCKFITSTLALSFTYMQTLEGLIFSGIWFSFNSKTSIHLSAIILHQGRGSTGAVRALPPIEYLKFVLIRVGRWSWVNSDKHKCKIQSPINWGIYQWRPRVTKFYVVLPPYPTSLLS